MSLLQLMTIRQRHVNAAVVLWVVSTHLYVYKNASLRSHTGITTLSAHSMYVRMVQVYGGLSIIHITNCQ